MKNALIEIKKMLTTKPILKAPFDKPFIILTDTSNQDVRVILCHKDKKGEDSIMISLLNKSEQNYVIEK